MPGFPVPVWLAGEQGEAPPRTESVPGAFQGPRLAVCR